MKKKILFYTTFLTQGGGIEVVTVRYMKKFLQEGYEVDYLEYLDSCSERPICKEQNGYFFNSQGESVSESEYRKDCFSCEYDGENYLMDVS